MGKGTVVIKSSEKSTLAQLASVKKGDLAVIGDPASEGFAEMMNNVNESVKKDKWSPQQVQNSNTTSVKLSGRRPSELPTH